MNFELNKNYHGFILEEERFIEEVKSKARLFAHEKSGARLMHLENDDDENVFSITFRTPPNNNTGLPHILEHSVLCGSRKFPSKEPFVELVKGSLNTFLNAFTFSDKTMYPVASRNEKDFFNLMDVYLDAVFYPNIYKYPEILMQEGWHYALSDPEGEIQYKGVVYNEMKGAFSSPDAVLMRKVQESLFPDTPYGVDSGGDPDFIPNLTYQEFIAFHKKYYHPSNSFIFLYGNGDIMKQLAFINEEYLKNFEKSYIDSSIPLQKPFTSINELTFSYPIAKDENEADKTLFAMSFALETSTDPEAYLALDILEKLLLANSAAPLKKALIDAQISKDVYGQYDDSILQPVLSIVLKNTNLNKKEEFKNIIYNTLQNLVNNGIDKKLIEARINYKEFQLREADYRGYPKGLMYNIKCMSSWLYDKDPMMNLQYEPIMKKIRSAMDSDYFEQLIKKYLINNTHCSLIILKPERGLAEEKTKNLKEKLARFKASLSEPQLNELVENSNRLVEKQVTPDKAEYLESIPLLELKDIETKAERLPQLVKEECGTKVLFHPIPTNNIAYLNLLFDAATVRQEDIVYVSLLSDVLGKLDTENYSYEELSKQIKIHAGELGFIAQVYGNQHNTSLYFPKLCVKAKVLKDKLPKLFELVEEIINKTKFDNPKRIREIIAELKSRKEMRMMNDGHFTVVRRLISYYSEQAKYTDVISGLSYHKFLVDIDKNFDAHIHEIIKKLKEAAKLVFNSNDLITGITFNEDGYNHFTHSYAGFVKQLGRDKIEKNSYKFQIGQHNEGLLTQSDVQYVAQGFNFRKLGWNYSGAVQVLATVAKYDYLWNRIRVQGGAYGAIAGFERNGNMYFASYRDPNLRETLKVYRDMPSYIRSFNIDNREMTKLIIGTISRIDSPLTPSMKGERAIEYYIRGISYEDMQRERDEILSCSQRDIISFSELIEELMSHNYLCVLGSEDKIKQNKDIFNNLITAFD